MSAFGWGLLSGALALGAGVSAWGTIRFSRAIEAANGDGPARLEYGFFGCLFSFLVLALGALRAAITGCERAREEPGATSAVQLVRR